MLRRRALFGGLAGCATPSFARRAAASGQVVLFRQPTFTNGIDPNFSVTNSKPAYNPVGSFYLHANQANPYRQDNDYEPVYWDPMAMTGLHVPGNLRSTWQRGILPNGAGSGPGHTVAQIYGDTVGAYMNSADLFRGSPGNRMMISPNFQFPNPVAPFVSATGALGLSLQLQVPVASDSQMNGISNSYAKADVLMVSRVNGARVSISFGLFANQKSPQHDGIGFDDMAKSAIIGALVSPLGQLVTIQPGSSMFQSNPWSGWRTFAVVMTRAQFATGLAAVAPLAASYGYQLSPNPSDYVLSTTHLNAELHFTAQYPARLGWSMRNLTIAAIT